MTGLFVVFGFFMLLGVTVGFAMLMAWGFEEGGFAYLFSPAWKEYRVPSDQLATLPDQVWKVMAHPVGFVPNVVRSKIRHVERIRATNAAWDRAAGADASVSEPQSPLKQYTEARDRLVAAKSLSQCLRCSTEVRHEGYYCSECLEHLIGSH